MTSGAGTTALTSPIRCASWAEQVSPIRIISIALARGTVLGKRWVPPAPGMIAHRTSVSPKTACSAATRTSQQSISSSPPASAYPFTAAMIGFQISRPRVIPPSPGSLWPRALVFPNACGMSFFRSAPAENAFSPAPVRIATQASGSSRNRVHASISYWCISGSTAFMASGRSIVIVTTRSCCS
jgi:hypothetical protein